MLRPEVPPINIKPIFCKVGSATMSKLLPSVCSLSIQFEEIATKKAIVQQLPLALQFNTAGTPVLPPHSAFKIHLLSL